VVARRHRNLFRLCTYDGCDAKLELFWRFDLALFASSTPLSFDQIDRTVL
jgi:hypothetical protein